METKLRKSEKSAANLAAKYPERSPIVEKVTKQGGEVYFRVSLFDEF